MSFLLKFAKKIVDVGKSDDKKDEKEGSNSKKNQEMNLAINKVNLNNIFNSKEDQYRPPSSMEFEDKNKLSQFMELFQSEIISYDMLKKLSWDGIPSDYRSRAWKILLKYLQTNQSTHAETLKRKRGEYKEYLKLYFEDMKESDRDENDKKIMKIIMSDVPRTQPECPLFHIEPVQQMLKRILYVWNVRHPASGYVQGINDLTTPFVAVFFNDYISINMDSFEIPKKIKEEVTEDMFLEMEADTYWCLCKILDYILDNYTNSQPGIQKALQKIKEITKKMDVELFNHLQKEGIDFFQFAFRWVYCLLIREFSLKLGLRLFDTYISDDEGFSILHIYVCSAIILKYGVKLKKMGFNDIMTFLQNLPTKEWNEEKLKMLIQEAYCFKSIFEKSQGHLQL